MNDRERIVPMSGAEEPAPLAALFFVDRKATGPGEPEFQASANAQMLLAATFNFVLATPERLRGLLDVCALAAQLRVELVSCGPGTDIPQLANAIERRLN